MWFKKKKAEPKYRDAYREFRVGQVVRHKVTHKKAVIVRIEDDDFPSPTVAVGWRLDEEFGTTFAEIEPAQADDAVDPHVANNPER